MSLSACYWRQGRGRLKGKEGAQRGDVGSQIAEVVSPSSGGFKKKKKNTAQSYNNILANNLFNFLFQTSSCLKENIKALSCPEGRLMLCSCFVCIYTSFAGNIALSYIFSHSVLIVAEDLAFQGKNNNFVHEK